MGDHDARFGSTLKFSDYDVRLVFRWSTRSRGASARWQIEANGAVVASEGLPRVPGPGEHHFLRVNLDSLRRHRDYTATVLVLSASGEVLARSNAVRLTRERQHAGPVFGTPIEETLERARERFAVPALGAAVVTRDFVQEIAVIGERGWGTGVAALVTDAWHLGSCTKAITATLIGVLVHRNLLAWTDTVATIFPEWADTMHPHFRNVTIVEYLAHRSHLAVPRTAVKALREPELGLLRQRQEFSRRCVEHAPRTLTPFPAFRYANGNYIVAATMAERAVADAAPRRRIVANSWEDLLRAELFAPLGMRSAGFGPPSDGRSPPSALWGHRADPSTGAIKPSQWDSVPAHGPAGRVRASLADWSKFIQLHLGSTVRGGRVAIGADTLERLHAPYRTLVAHDDGYFGGWVIDRRHDSLSLFHNGSNFRWYAAVTVFPELGVAFLGTTNVNHPGPVCQGGCQAVSAVLDSLEKEYFAERHIQADTLSRRPYSRIQR